MNKKVLLGIILGVIAAIVVIVVSVVAITGGKSSTKKVAKDFAKAVKSEEAMEKFAKKNVDFKYSYALSEMSMIVNKNAEKSDLEKQFKEILKDADSEDIDNYKEIIIKRLKNFVDEDGKIKLKKMGKAKEYEPNPILKLAIAEYEDGEGDEVEYGFLFYKEKLVLVEPASEFETQNSKNEIEKNNKEMIDEWSKPSNSVTNSTNSTGGLSVGDILGNSIYSNAQNAIESAKGQISQQEKDIYNAIVKPYINEGIKGSEVKSMLDAIVSMNQANVGEQGKFIQVSAENITNYANNSDLEEACNTAYSNNSTSNVSTATKEMTILKSKINSQKRYDVEADYENGIIVKVEITEVKQ